MCVVGDICLGHEQTDEPSCRFAVMTRFRAVLPVSSCILVHRRGSGPLLALPIDLHFLNHPPGLNGAHNRLGSFMNVNVLDADMLLALTAMPIQSP